MKYSHSHGHEHGHGSHGNTAACQYQLLGTSWKPLRVPAWRLSRLRGASLGHRAKMLKKATAGSIENKGLARKRLEGRGMAEVQKEFQKECRVSLLGLDYYNGR